MTRNNPLDFESRKQLILQEFPDVNVLYIKDNKSDEIWSRNLDEMISDLVSPNQSVVLYGGRDSFIRRYSGKYPTQELVPKAYISGTEIRNKLSKKVKASSEWRHGVIWAAYNQFKKVWPTVDIAILSEDNKKVLLARKPDQKHYLFIGGFAEPHSATYELDAKREVQEEAGVEVSDPVYVCSAIINDWRYRGEVDKIKTIFFKATYLFGSPQAADDVCEVRWFDLLTIDMDIIADQHKQLMVALLKNLGIKQEETK